MAVQIGPEHAIEWKTAGRHCGRPDGRVNWVRYSDPKRPDDIYTLWPGFTSWQRRDMFSFVKPGWCTYSCVEGFATGAAKTELYRIRLLELRPVLASLSAAHVPAGIQIEDGRITWLEEPFQLRQVYVVEMIPKTSDAYGVIAYIDKETYLWLGGEFIDTGGAKKALVFMSWAPWVSTPGKRMFVFGNESYIPLDQPGLFLSLNLPGSGLMNAGGISDSVFSVVGAP